jgi:hypothetical protein
MRIIETIMVLYFCYFIINNIYSYSRLTNIFNTDIFDNKDIFLIANNSNLTIETQIWLNNYDTTNTVVVRFNGYKKTIEKYMNGKSDVMVFRDIPDKPCSFSGIDLTDTTHNINKITKRAKYNVFTVKTDEIGISDIPICNKNLIYTLSTSGFTNLKGSYALWGLTSGFNFLIHLLNRKETLNYRTLYLIGFTFHNKKDNLYHFTKWEYEYFRDNIENKYNVIIKL